MKIILSALILLSSLNLAAQKIPVKNIEAKVGLGREALVKEYTGQGFSKDTATRRQGLELAERLTKLSAVHCNVETFTNGQEEAIYIIYNADDVCVGFTFSKKTCSTSEYKQLNDSVLALNYKCIGRIYTNSSETKTRSFYKGERYFLLSSFDGKAGYSITAHCLSARKKAGKVY